MNPQVDAYLAQGCGRCALFQTPDCKVHSWQSELAKLREIVVDAGLTEELKWSMPVYTANGANIVMVAAMKEYAALSFFKGVLLKDPDRILTKSGEDSQSVRLIKFTDVRQIAELELTLRAYLNEAVENEKAGLKVEFKHISEREVPVELLQKFDEDPKFHAAFQALTPGRQRSYYIHISQSKQPATRIARIEKCMPKIFLGKGFHDR